MIKVTLWSRIFVRDRVETMEYNHLEIGHTKNVRPTPIGSEQATAWKGAEWSLQLTYMNDQRQVL